MYNYIAIGCGHLNSILIVLKTWFKLSSKEKKTLNRLGHIKNSFMDTFEHIKYCQLTCIVESFEILKLNY